MSVSIREHLQTKLSLLEVNKVYKTNDLSIFKFTKFNRNVVIRKEMLKQAKEGFISPVVVNENFYVIDGQHRIEHAKKAEVPIEFIIKPGLNEHDIVRMNTTQKPWSLKNYIESYANQDKEEYVKLLNLLNQRYAGVSEVISISLNKSFTNSKVSDIVKSGNFKFDNFNYALTFLRFYKKFKEETKTPTRSNIVLALFELYRLKDIDMDRLISKVIQTKFDEELRVKSYNYTEALKQLIDVYNHHITEKSPKFIEYYVTNKGEIKISKNN